MLLSMRYLIYLGSYEILLNSMRAKKIDIYIKKVLTKRGNCIMRYLTALKNSITIGDRRDELILHIV